MTVDTTEVRPAGRRSPRAGGTAPERVAALARLLGDPARVRIVELLRSAAGGEVCQCELQPLLSISQPTLSHHLRKLTDAGLVVVERRGRWAYYAVDELALRELAVWLS